MLRLFFIKSKILNFVPTLKRSVMEIKDNTLLRQFEANTNHGMAIVEYALQERKIFLTKLHIPEDTEDGWVKDFIATILEIAEEKKWKVVPTHPKIVALFRKNHSFKQFLPPGIKI